MNYVVLMSYIRTYVQSTLRHEWCPNTWANKDSKSLDVRITYKNRENKTAHT